MTNQNNHPNNDMQAVRGLGQLPNAPTTLPTLTNQNNDHIDKGVGFTHHDDTDCCKCPCKE